VDSSRLVAVGYGAEQLLDPDQPNDARNRRVEIRDLGAAP
jgi:flagellar motor protein MotB